MHTAKKLLYSDLLAYLVTFLLINLFCLNINLNADTLFPFRYIQTIFSGNEYLLTIQPGPRFVPEWLYSSLAYTLTDKPLVWSRIVIAINTLMLMASFHYFFSQTEVTRKQISSWVILSTLAIPILYLFHKNVLIYFVFSPGIHGFLVPFLFYSLGLTLYFLKRNATSYKHLFLTLFVGALLVFSNIHFIVMALAPIVSCVVVLKLFKTVSLKKLTQISFFTLASIILGFFFIVLFELINTNIIIESGGFSFFNTTLGDWVFKNDLITNLQKRNVSGPILEVIIAAILSAVITTLVAPKRQINTPLFLNLFYIFSILIFLFSSWAVDKTLMRLIPHILVLSPIILLFNLSILYKSLISKKPRNFGIYILLLGLATTMLNHRPKSPYIQYNEINNQIASLRKKDLIKGSGLADYWIAHTFFSADNIKILPVNTKLEPRLFATDIQSFWLYEKGIKKERFVDFVVSRTGIKKDDWSIKEKQIINQFGQWSHMHEFFENKRKFKIYIYENGLELDNFYQYINNHIKNHTD